MFKEVYGLMRFMHTKCGGSIDTRTRTCIKCKKHWNWLTWWTTATEIRPMPEVPTRKPRRASAEALRAKKYHPRKQYAGWGNKIPGVGTIASRLPNWPRWTRILVTVAFVAVVVLIIILVVK